MTKSLNSRWNAFTAILLALGACFSMLAAAHGDAARPNIVWIVTEDNSANYLRLYDEGGAPMPNVERLAEQGIVFNHAFSNSPVCSTARSSIISGCYGPRLFTNFHRRSELVPLPKGVHMFPWYLKRAGYYTTNNAKEDYNFIAEENVWDNSSGKATFRDRAEGQPFFHVQNFGTTHEGRLHFSEDEMTPTVTDPATVNVSAVHPDTEIFRYMNARYRDLHRNVDVEIGKFLKQLEDDGLMENTIIFFYGDHGGVLPGSKGYIYERGLQVPMVVRAPEKWQSLMPAAPGSRVDGFVSFVDLAPTVLKLAGVEGSALIDGKAFLGEDIDLKEFNKRDTNLSYADRFDEKYDMVRALRVRNFKYMRNYQPFNPDGLWNDYRYKNMAYREWYQMYKDGELTAEQSQFFEARPAETLFDLANDPEELHNLADDPKYRQTLLAMREELTEKLKAFPDLSFYPESELLKSAVSGPVEFGQRSKAKIGGLIDVADLSLKDFSEVKGSIKKALKSKDPWKRYWGVIVCSSFGEDAKSLSGIVSNIAESDPENLVRLRAVEYLGLIGEKDPREGMIACLKNADSEVEAGLVLNTITLFRMVGDWPAFELEDEWVKADWLADVKRNVSRRYEYLNN